MFERSIVRTTPATANFLRADDRLGRWRFLLCQLENLPDSTSAQGEIQCKVYVKTNPKIPKNPGMAWKTQKPNMGISTKKCNFYPKLAHGKLKHFPLRSSLGALTQESTWMGAPPRTLLGFHNRDMWNWVIWSSGWYMGDIWVRYGWYMADISHNMWQHVITRIRTWEMYLAWRHRWRLCGKWEWPWSTSQANGKVSSEVGERASIWWHYHKTNTHKCSESNQSFRALCLLSLQFHNTS